MPPKVSIVLPTYNGAQRLRRSIESCLSQTCEDIELIIVDDGSTDETPAILSSYSTPRLSWVRHTANQGLPAALNAGFARAAAPFLTWNSDDNFYAPHAAARMLEFLEAAPQYGFVYCDFYSFKEDAVDVLHHERLEDQPRFEVGNSVGPCFLYRREVMERVGEYDRETILAEDYDYWIRISKQFRIAHLAEPLCYYCFHARALTATRGRAVEITACLVRVKHRLIEVTEGQSEIERIIMHSLQQRCRKGAGIACALFSPSLRLYLQECRCGSLSVRAARERIEYFIDRHPYSRMLKLLGGLMRRAGL